jgi:ParB family chromosome partitioning protein
MAFQGDSIYWVEVEKVVPNPFQPRREFDQHKLQELADSIRMYGVLQPLTVTRKEIQREDGTFYTEYELIAGERRLRATRLAGVAQVPVIIRDGEQTEQEKLELAIIENLQREDLNAVDRALAFRQLSDVFGLSHTQVAQKVGRSREYVSNSIRLLGLPEHMLDALRLGKLSEGHARTLLMLNDRKEEQEVVFQEILLKKLSVREVERIARKIATDKIRKRNPDEFDAHLIDIEKRFTETLGTRVQIQKTDFGGKLTIDYFSTDDLEVLLLRIRQEQQNELAAKQAADTGMATLVAATPLAEVAAETELVQPDVVETPALVTELPGAMFIPEVSDEDASDMIIEPEEDDSDLYSINSFTV